MRMLFCSSQPSPLANLLAAMYYTCAFARLAAPQSSPYPHTYRGIHPEPRQSSPTSPYPHHPSNKHIQAPLGSVKISPNQSHRSPHSTSIPIPRPTHLHVRTDNSLEPPKHALTVTRPAHNECCTTAAASLPYVPFSSYLHSPAAKPFAPLCDYLMLRATGG
jgi:hypothetical protein